MLFGQNPIEPQTFAERVVRDVIRRVNRGQDWTKAVKATLLDIGVEKGCYVAPHAELRQGEYMLDIVWFRNSDTADIVLAVECEWGGKRNVLEDFDKLLHIKAPLKVMIFSTSRHDEQAQAVLKEIQASYMEKFTQHVEGEHYILIEFVDPQKKAFCHSYLVPTNGQLEKVEFQAVEIGYPLAGTATST